MNQVTLDTRFQNELDSDKAALRALEEAEALSPLPQAQEIQDALPEKGVTVGLHRLMARIFEDMGREDEADRILLQILERLNQAGYWQTGVRIMEELIERHAHTVCPLVLRARIQGGSKAVSDDLLIRAHDLLPRHGLLAWHAAQACEAAGEKPRARAAALKALVELLEDKNYAPAEEAALYLDDAKGGDVAAVFLTALQILVRQHEWDRFETFLELAASRLAAPEGAPAAWPVLRDLWLKHPDPEKVRTHVVEVCHGYLQDFPDPAGILRVSRINIPSEEPPACLERFRKAVLFPTGYYALHSAWGIGLVRDNDTEAVVIDFPTKPAHRMTLPTAERALDALSPLDLRVLKVHDPEELKRLVKEEHATVVVRALERLSGHEGTGDQIRKTLVPGIIPPTGWAGWWKTAKNRLNEDPRVDARRAYENAYRLRRADEVDDGIELPVWNARQDTVKNLAVLDTFLEQHPGDRDRLIETVAGQVTEVAQDTRVPAPQRAAAILWLEGAGLDAPLAPGDLVTGDFDFNALPKTVQTSLVEKLTEPQPLANALDSRLQAIRRTAWAGIAESPDMEAVAMKILATAPERPEAALFLLETGLAESSRIRGGEWTQRIMNAFLDLVELPPRETHRKRVMALAVPGTALAEALIAAPIDEEDMGRYTSRLKNWRASDRFRFPLLDFLRVAGHGHITEEVEGHRLRAAAKIADRVVEDDSDPYDGATVLTRPTMDRLERERNRVGMELKTTIPMAIAKARELGDLKENAEYHAAKEKQANFAKRFEELENRLQKVVLIEDMDREAGVALPGTEVTLEPAAGGDPMTFWLLGEGDQELGESVISFQAAIGEAVYGRRKGDEVSLPGDDGEVAYRVAGVVERLP